MKYPLPSEIIKSIDNPFFILDKDAKQGYFSRNNHKRLLSYSGGFCIVFKYEKEGKKKAFRCWHKDPGASINAQKYLAVSQYLQTNPCTYFLPFHYNPEGILVDGMKFPTLTMEWREDKLLKDYIADNLNNQHKVLALAKELERMFVVLHKLKMAHGDLQHGNILIDLAGKPILLDYDSIYVPYLKGEKATIAGYDNYQHPGRKSQRLLTEKMDYFSEVVITVSILGIALNAKLWEAYKVKDSEGLLFDSSDFNNIKESRIYGDLLRLRNEKINFLLDTLVAFLEKKDINMLHSVWESDEYRFLGRPSREDTVSMADYLSQQSDLKIAHRTIQSKENQLERMKESYLDSIVELKRIIQGKDEQLKKMTESHHNSIIELKRELELKHLEILNHLRHEYEEKLRLQRTQIK